MVAGDRTWRIISIVERKQERLNVLEGRAMTIQLIQQRVHVGHRDHESDP